MPINALIWNVMRSYQKQQMTFKDIRINLINEILSGIKVIKLYDWEKSLLEKISEIRYRIQQFYFLKNLFLNLIHSEKKYCNIICNINI